MDALEEKRRHRRAAQRMLVVAIAGLVTAFASGAALIPRVHLVEVLTVVAGAIGAGAALTAAIVEWQKTRG